MKCQTCGQPLKGNKALKAKEAQLLEIVQRITGRNFRVLPQRGISKLLDTYALHEIEYALTNLSHDKWHREHLMGLDYLLRPTTIDKFLNQKSNVPARGYA